MTVSYEGLWRILKIRRLRRQNLVEDLGISPITISKMGRGELVTAKIIDKICAYLNCEPKDIMSIL